jgi:S1-C subfamily serine protease
MAKVRGSGSRSVSRTAFLTALALAAACVAIPPAVAQTAPSEPSAEARAADLERRRAKLEQAHAATVGIVATAVEDARSNETLGRTRTGSGVLIEDGLVLTIGYLILEAERVDLVMKDGRKVPARVVAYDLASGFGLLQALTPTGAAPAPIGASGATSTDEPLVIMSGGEESGLSLARLVSRRDFAGYWEYHIEGALFTAPARGDHSGAGLFNADGELVGIGSLVVGDAGGTERPGIRGNMFVPLDLLKPIFSELRTQGASRSSHRPWLGINSVEYGGQVRVLRVNRESPASEAGLQPGDAIVGVDGTPVRDLAGFYKALWKNPVSEREVALEVRRGAETVRIGVKSVDRMKTLSRPQGV